MDTEQGNRIGGKESQKQLRQSEPYLFATFEVPEKHQANSCNPATDDLVQTHTQPMLAM